MPAVKGHLDYDGLLNPWTHKKSNRSNRAHDFQTPDDFLRQGLRGLGNINDQGIGGSLKDGQLTAEKTGWHEMVPPALDPLGEEFGCS